MHSTEEHLSNILFENVEGSIPDKLFSLVESINPNGVSLGGLLIQQV
jgi:hypothetical protein